MHPIEPKVEVSEHAKAYRGFIEDLNKTTKSCNEFIDGLDNAIENAKNVARKIESDGSGFLIEENIKRIKEEKKKIFTAGSFNSERIEQTIFGEFAGAIKRISERQKKISLELDELMDNPDEMMKLSNPPTYLSRESWGRWVHLQDELKKLSDKKSNGGFKLSEMQEKLVAGEIRGFSDKEDSEKLKEKITKLKKSMLKTNKQVWERSVKEEREKLNDEIKEFKNAIKEQYFSKKFPDVEKLKSDLTKKRKEIVDIHKDVNQARIKKSGLEETANYLLQDLNLLIKDAESYQNTFLKIVVSVLDKLDVGSLFKGDWSYEGYVKKKVESKKAPYVELKGKVENIKNRLRKEGVDIKKEQAKLEEIKKEIPGMTELRL